MMIDQPTILILTSKTGGGHISLAEALRDRLANNYKLEIVDPQPGFFHWHYRLVSRNALWLWSAEFRATDTPQRAYLAHRLFTPTVTKPLTALLARVRPALIITTYPFLTYAVMETLIKTNSSIPFVMLFSDPNGVHASWLTEKRATVTFATSRETYDQALSVGFDSQRLHLVGWPVRNQFYQTPQRAETLTKLGLDPDRFTVFLQGGGEGAAQFGQTIERTLETNSALQIILATGTNQALLTHFQATRNLAALPFTKEIAPFMAAADVIMGKAGPNMLFESVTLGKPFIATAYIPGQEEANLEFIERHQLGWVALRADEQRSLLGQLTTNRIELEKKAATVEAYRQWNMATNEKIVPLISSLLENGLMAGKD